MIRSEQALSETFRTLCPTAPKDFLNHGDTTYAPAWTATVIVDAPFDYDNLLIILRAAGWVLEAEMVPPNKIVMIFQPSHYAMLAKFIWKAVAVDAGKPGLTVRIP